MKRSWRWPALVGGWCSAVALGFGIVALHGAEAGQGARAPAHWPAEAAIARDAASPTLLVVIHPKCPCSRATVRELERLLARNTRPLRTVAVFVRPGGTPDGWERGDLYEAARAIRGVEVFVDVAGKTARGFGAATSGQAILYGAGGELLFAGGLTVARGHEGDSPGAAAIEAALGSERAAQTTRVFGCDLIGERDGT